MLAEETDKLLTQGAKVVILESAVAGADNNPARSPNVIRLKKCLRRAKVLAVVSPALEASPAGPPRLSLAGFEEVAKNYPAATAIISLVGVPPLTDETVLLPKLLAFVPTISSPAEIQREWFTSKRIALLIVPRFTSDDSAPVVDSNSRAWFDQNFQIITAENLPGDPPQSSNSPAPSPRLLAKAKR